MPPLYKIQNEIKQDYKISVLIFSRHTLNLKIVTCGWYTPGDPIESKNWHLLRFEKILSKKYYVCRPFRGLRIRTIKGT